MEKLMEKQTDNITSTPVCPVCGGASLFESALPTSKVYYCTKCSMIHAKGDLKSENKSVVDTDPNFFKAIIASYELQCKAAQRIVPLRLAT
jgi:ribosomal protein L37AE/L43A